MSSVLEGNQAKGDPANSDGNKQDKFGDKAQQINDFLYPPFPSWLPFQQYELNRPFTYDPRIASRMTASNFSDHGIQRMFDDFYSMGNSYTSPLYAGSLASPLQVPVDTSTLSNLASSTSIPLTGSDESPTPSTAHSQQPACIEPQPTDRSLPTPKDTWTSEQEQYLLAAKKNRCTLKAISAAMTEKFGVERNTNVLSKKYRAIRDREARETILDQALKNTLPNMLEVLEEEMRRLDPDSMDEQELNEIRRELLKKLPAFVHRLALG
ncbi:hypothetical protein F5Y19DRAFT_377565 [Xylariaceae sp. FL1651]|nr:hypothetical protein F5Y19DRAFT_377565 [Xylariaceae sp. FL1651]